MTPQEPVKDTPFFTIEELQTIISFRFGKQPPGIIETFTEFLNSLFKSKVAPILKWNEEAAKKLEEWMATPLVEESLKLKADYDLQRENYLRVASIMDKLIKEKEVLVSLNATYREILGNIKAGLGDRLLANGPLSKEYAHSIMNGINDALATATATEKEKG